MIFLSFNKRVILRVKHWQFQLCLAPLWRTKNDVCYVNLDGVVYLRRTSSGCPTLSIGKLCVTNCLDDRDSAFPKCV